MTSPTPVNTLQPVSFRPCAISDSVHAGDMDQNNALNNALKATARVRAIELRREAVRDFWRAVGETALRAVQRVRGVLRFNASLARPTRQLEV